MLDTVTASPVDAVPLSADDARKLESLLLRVGISVVGARQFALSQPMTSPTDRQRAAKLLARMVGL
jgi:hypothetical protein